MVTKDVQLDPKAYWELRAADLAVSEIMREAEMAAATFKSRLHAAIRKRSTLYEALASQHGFDPEVVYAFKDEACALQRLTGD